MFLEVLDVAVVNRVVVIADYGVYLHRVGGEGTNGPSLGPDMERSRNERAVLATPLIILKALR